MATPTVGSPGDNKAFVDGVAIVLPLVIDSTHGQFKYNGNDYVVAAATYKYLDKLVAAVNAAAQTGDASRLDVVLKASASPFVAGAIRFTAAAAGTNTNTFATGTTHDGIAKVGLTNGAALAHGAAAISTGRSFASSLTTNQTPPSAAGHAGNLHNVQSVVAGDGITVDSTDPLNPIVTAS